MAILYPDQIDNIYINGVEFTGNVVSVGTDGNYSYDYTHPRTATNSEANGTLVLIYPGSYNMYFNYLITNKDVLWRGMGDLPTDVSIHSQSSQYTILRVDGTYSQAILDNISAPNGYQTSDNSVIQFTDGSSSTNIYINKGRFGCNVASFGPSAVGFEDYLGNVYASYTYIEIDTNKESQFGFVGFVDAREYVAVAMEYNEAYRCTSCNGWDVHTYTDSPSTGFGYNYGDYLIEFNVPPETIITELGDALYQNVWSVNNYVYHTTTSGINVYNDKVFDYSIPLNTPATAVWANENYIYMGTLTSGVYVASISGSAAPYKQEPNITSNSTVYLHGAGDYLCVTTNAGVDRYTISSGTRISKLKNYLHKCYQTSTGDFYYIENTRFYNIDIEALGAPLKNWNYYQNITFDATTIENSQVYIDFAFNFPFHLCRPDGGDLRFVAGPAVYKEVVNEIGTVNLCTGGTVTSLNTTDPTNIFDGNEANYGIVDNSPAGWIGYEFTASQPLTKVRIKGDGYGYYGSYFVIKGSDVGTFTGEESSLLDDEFTANAGWQEFTLVSATSPKYYKYIRLYNLGFQPWLISEMEFYGVDSFVYEPVSAESEILSYYIESWYPNARVVVKVPGIGVTSFYMLYGNDHAASQSDPYSAYYLYDDFEGTELDTDKWRANTRGDGSVTVANSVVTIRDDDNDGCEIMTREKVPYGYTISKIRWQNGSDTTQMDAYWGYSLTNTGRTNRGSVNIDIVPGANDFLHRLVPYWTSNVQGTRNLSEGWKTHELIFSNGFQQSTYEEEILTATASGIDSENYLYFHINNDYTNPDLQIDYVKHSTYPINETTTSTHQELWVITRPNLHAVYDRDTDWTFPNYTYNVFYANPNLFNDIYVTEGTSTLSGSNVIFIGTDTCAFVMEEHQSDELNAKIKYFLRG